MNDGLKELKVKTSEGKELVLIPCICDFYRLQDETCKTNGCPNNPATKKRIKNIKSKQGRKSKKTKSRKS